MIAAGYESIRTLVSNTTIELTIYKKRLENRLYLIKTIKNNEFSSNSFKKNNFDKELEIALTLEHRNIARPVTKIDEGLDSIVYSYNENEPLSNLLKSNKAFQINEALTIIIQLLDVLEYLHSRGIILNINPEMILVGERHCLEIVDFENSVYENDVDIMQDGMIIGTFPYLSPEQTGFTAFKIDTRSDLYCVGLLFYRLLSGRMPFEVEKNNLEELLNSMLKTEIEPIRNIPVMLNEILLKALRPTPSERYQTATGFISDLKNAVLQIENEISAPFVVGERDAAIAVNRTKIFISRDHELKILESGFDLFKRGETLAYLLVGVSGIGKTEIINSFKKKLKSQANIITIKCNRFTPNQPYSVLYQLVDTIIYDIKNNHKDTIVEEIKKEFEFKLQNDSGIICKIFPIAKELFSQISDSTEVERERESSRNSYLIATVIEIILNIIPSIVIIDDLQWIDKISFDILRKIRKKNVRCMLIFTFRIEKDINKSHIYNVPVNEITERLINVTPFTANDIRCYLDLVFDNIKESVLLSRIILEKSSGNPLVIREIVEFLVTSAIVKRVDTKWNLSLEKIGEIPTQFDQVSLIIYKFKGMETEEQLYLQLCALFEGVIGKTIVEKLGNYDNSRSNEILRKLELYGFLMRNLNGEYSFIHDKIQQIILDDIEPAKKIVLYERLAEEYVNLIDTDQIYIIAAAETYLKTSNLFKSYQLSMQAARYAVDKVAFDLAIKQYRNCILIIDQMRRKGLINTIPLYQIESELADVLMLNGRNEQALILFNKVLNNQNQNDSYFSLLLKYKIGCIYHNTGNFEKSIPNFTSLLNELGLKIPKNRLKLFFATIKEAFVQIFLSVLFACIKPKKRKPTEILKVKILNKLSYSLYFDDMIVCLFAHFKAMNLADRLVDCYEKAEAFSLHGPPSYQLFLKKRGFKFVRKSLQIAEKLKRRDITAFSESFYGIILYFNAQWSKAEKYLKSSIKKFESIGDNSSQILCIEHLWRIYFMRGEFNEAEMNISHTIKMSEEVNDQHFLMTAQAAQYYLMLLKGENPDTKKLEDLEKRLDPNLSFLTQTHAGVSLVQIDIFNNNFDSASKRLEKLLSLTTKKNINSEYTLPLLISKTELLLRNLLSNKSKDEIKKININFLKFLGFTFISSISYPAYKGAILRLMAWYCHYKKRNHFAHFLFKKSINTFHAHDMKYEKARSIRDYGFFLIDMNKPGLARDQFDIAYTLFEMCGAKAELDTIKDKVSAYLLKRLNSDSSETYSIFSKENSNQIRFDTLLEVSSSMSQINELPVLLEQILTSLTKATGAQYGCLLLKNSRGELEKTLLRDFNGKDLDPGDVVIAQSIIEKTAYQKQTIIIRGNNIITNENGKIRSVLCTPLLREGNFMGCVYLGNDKVTGLFSESAVKTAQIISAQASILLENALLMRKYIQLNQELDNKIKQQTRDIVEKNHQLELTNLKLIESERMKEILSGTLVHDIKNYAAGIEGNLQFLSRRLSNDLKIRRIIDVVGETCTDIVSLASNLLDIAKMDEGKLVVHAEKLSAEFIEGMAEKFITNPLFEEKDIHPIIQHTEEKFCINADVYLIERIFQNIYSNAAKYVPRNGKVELSFHYNENEVIICFFNSGIPIPDKEKEILFEKYARLDNRQSQYSKGLGLFFCKMVMNAHKGRIWLDTDELGNYFKLAFPISTDTMISSSEIYNDFQKQHSNLN